MVRISAMVLFCFERCMAVSRFGMAMAARMPMIATTISSSIRVKPFWFLLIHVLLWFGHPSLAQRVYQWPRLTYLTDSTRFSETRRQVGCHFVSGLGGWK